MGCVGSFLSLIVVLVVAVSAEVKDPHVRTRQVRKETVEFIRDGPIVLVADHSQNVTSIATQNHRRLQQTRTVLVVRVVNSGVGPSVNTGTIRQYIFTDTNSVKAQMMKCSVNSVILTESRYGVNGVIDVPVNTGMNAADLMHAAREAAPQYIGVTDLRAAADHVMFILPKIPDYFAEAEVEKVQKTLEHGCRFSVENTSVTSSIAQFHTYIEN